MKPVEITTMPEVTLASLPALAGQLAARVRAAGFKPGVVVYVERGARLLAWELCREFDCGAIAVTARRGGAQLKRLVAPVARFVPRPVRDGIRRLEERWFWPRGGGRPRTVTSGFSGSLAKRRVLLVDDAADSGRTIAGCRAWLSQRGVPREDVRVAVLAATTPAGRAAVDFWILDRNSRLPWSSDSRELAAAEAAWAERRPPRCP